MKVVVLIMLGILALAGLVIYSLWVLFGAVTSHNKDEHLDEDN